MWHWQVEKQKILNWARSVGQCIIPALHYPEFEAQFRKLPTYYVKNTNSNENKNILSYPDLSAGSKIIRSDEENCQCDMWLVEKQNTL